MLNEACPYCGSGDIEAYEGFSYGVSMYGESDESVIDSQQCNACGKKFFGVYRFCQFKDENGRTIVG